MIKLNKKTITLAVLMAVVPAAATAAEYNGLSGAFNVNSTAEDTNVVVKQPNAYTPAIQVASKSTTSTVKADGGTLDINFDTLGIQVGNQANLTIGSDLTTEVTLTNSGSNPKVNVAIVQAMSGGNLTMKGQTIKIVSTATESIVNPILNKSGVVTIGSGTGTVTITANGSDKSTAVTSKENDFGNSNDVTPQTTILGETIAITSSGSGIYNANESTLTVGGKTTKTLTVTANGKDSYGLANKLGASATLDAQSINITGNKYGIQNMGDKLTVGSDQTTDLTIKANGASGKGRGVDAGSGSTTILNGHDITIEGSDLGVISRKSSVTVNAANTLTVKSTGLSGLIVQGNDEGQTQANPAELIINAKKTDITVTGKGGAALEAFSNGTLTINGDLEAEAAAVLIARGNSTVNINQDGKSTVNLKGDINFQTPGPGSSSGVILNAFVNLNLTGKDSSWTGNVVTFATNDLKDQEITGLNLKVSDGATWNVTTPDMTLPEGAESIAFIKQEKIDSLSLNNGVITMDSPNASALVENLSGTGGTINAAVTKAADGTLTSGAVVVEKVDTTSATPAMTVNYTGVTSDDMTTKNTSQLKALKAAETAEAALDKVTITETAPEGDLYGKWERKTQGDKVTESRGDNTKLQKFDAVNAIAFVQWRNEINHLTKRLGDVRASDGNLGGWARVYGGESRWGSNSIEVDHQTVQVGADTRVNNEWLVGGAFSYTHSDGTYAGGETNGDGYSLAGYATYLADNGVYVDVIARYGYLKNDMKADNMAINTANNAFSLSTEMGHQFRWNDRAYIEPQVEFTYGWIGGDKATASNNVRIEQDDYQSFITRVGVRSGFDFPNKAGTIYGMASYAYDFLGDADGTASKDGQSVALHEDLGGGWFTYGLGAQFAVGKSAYVYGELERTSGGEVENPYMFNVGARIFF